MPKGIGRGEKFFLKTIPSVDVTYVNLCCAKI